MLEPLRFRLAAWTAMAILVPLIPTKTAMAANDDDANYSAYHRGWRTDCRSVLKLLLISVPVGIGVAAWLRSVEDDNRWENPSASDAQYKAAREQFNQIDDSGYLETGIGVSNEATRIRAAYQLTGILNEQVSDFENQRWRFTLAERLKGMILAEHVRPRGEGGASELLVSLMFAFDAATRERGRPYPLFTATRIRHDVLYQMLYEESISVRRSAVQLFPDCINDPAIRNRRTETRVREVLP